MRCSSLGKFSVVVFPSLLLFLILEFFFSVSHERRFGALRIFSLDGMRVRFAGFMSAVFFSKSYCDAIESANVGILHVFGNDRVSIGSFRKCVWF